jgi:hypothetical protein
VHAANAPPSSEHSNVEFDSFAEKVKLASLLSVVASGPESIVVCGGVYAGAGMNGSYSICRKSAHATNVSPVRMQRTRILTSPLPELPLT